MQRAGGQVLSEGEEQGTGSGLGVSQGCPLDHLGDDYSGADTGNARGEQGLGPGVRESPMLF